MDIETVWAFASEHWGKITGALGTLSGAVIALRRKRSAARSKLAAQKKRAAAINSYLDGLPAECKAVLAEFMRDRSHTVALDATADAVRILVRQGAITEGGRVSGSSLGRYYTLKPELRPFLID